MIDKIMQSGCQGTVNITNSVIQSLLLSLVSDAKEYQFVASSDVPGVYLNVNMNYFVLLKVSGQTAKIMV